MEEGTFILVVSDNGVGLPDDVHIENPQKLGLQLVVSLTNQLDGKIILDKTHGSKYTIKFRELVYKKRFNS